MQKKEFDGTALRWDLRFMFWKIVNKPSYFVSKQYVKEPQPGIVRPGKVKIVRHLSSRQFWGYVVEADPSSAMLSIER